MEPLILNNWQRAMGSSPHTGLGLLKNVDIDAFPGALKAAKQPLTMFHTSFSVTFTADAGTDVITFASGTVPTTGTAVTVSNSGGALPTGLSAATNYFIIKISSSTAKLATTIANANASTAIDITGAGTGTHTITSVNPGTIMHFVRDSRTNNIFLQDSNGRVWYQPDSSGQAFLLNGNTLTNSAGNGIVILPNSDLTATYLLAFRNASIDIVNVFGTTQVEAPSWTNAWQSLNSTAGSGNSHYAIRAQDNIVYFCDGRYVGSLRENSASVFDPANAATYTYSNQSLDLPSGKTTYWLEELGINLLISVSNDDKLYPWDRTSDSYNLPIPLPEYGGNKMKNIGNIVYILCGLRGNIYQTQGTYVKPYATLPDYAINNGGQVQSNIVTWGGIGANGGALLVGAGVITTGNSGMYKIYPDGRVIIDNQPSTGSTNVTALMTGTSGDFYLMGYASGADYFDTSRYSNYECIVHSELARVATKTEKGHYSVLEVVAAKKLTSGSGSVRVSYRTDTLAAFTTLDTFTFNSANDATQKNDSIGLIDIENIQVQIEYSGSVELVEVRLLP